MRLWPNRIGHLASDQRVAGSSPARRVLLRPSLRKIAVGLRRNKLSLSR